MIWKEAAVTSFEHLRDFENQRKTYVHVVGILVEIGTEHLSHTSLERYR
jgi:hypothetical protein